MTDCWKAPTPDLVICPSTPSTAIPRAFVLEPRVSFQMLLYETTTLLPASYHPASPGMMGLVEDCTEPPFVDNRYCVATMAVTEWGDEICAERNTVTGFVVAGATGVPPSVA